MDKIEVDKKFMPTLEIVREDWMEMMEFDLIVVVNIRSLYNNDFIAS